MPEILIGEYLFRRLKQIGIDTVFGVPGDYELALLDQVEPQGLAWIGTPNELIGAYAADGYARVKGVGALVTTFGPGELSALCGIGGSFTEKVPVIHIVGYPPVPDQKAGKLLHHTLGDGDYNHYETMSSHISCATTVLRDPATAASEIDRVLNAMLYHSEPGYIGISEDIAYSKVSDTYLQTPLTRTLPPSAPESEALALAEIVKTLSSAKAPVLIVDGGAARGDWASSVDPLISALQIPFFTTIIGKGIADETSPLYGGCFNGAGSWPPTVLPTIEASDVLLFLGNYPSDFNTGIFTTDLSSKLLIDLQRFSATIGPRRFDARINHLLPKLARHPFSLPSHPSFTRFTATPPPAPTSTTAITHAYLWPRLTPFLRSGDILVTETGTAQAGINATVLPSGVTAFTQAIYGSIGFATGAAVGASIAAKETGAHSRLVLVTGEGSLMLTVQALTLLQRHGIPPVVLILNNKGYTVERFFRGWEAGYNDLPEWDYGMLAEGFSPGLGVETYKVEAEGELDALLSGALQGGGGEGVAKVVDMVMDKEDAPEAMKRLFEEKKRRIMAAAAAGK